MHPTVPKGNMGYDQYTVPDDCSCRTYICCFPLALENTFPWPFVPILSNFFEERRTQNHPQCLSRNSCIFYSNLNWKPYLHELSKKISRGIGVLSKIRHYVNGNILLQLHYSPIYPFLTFGLSFWGNTYCSTLRPLKILQKKATRIITFSEPGV